MGKKSKGSGKKGPRGKKARAKAKLQRQWGEEARESEDQGTSLRFGKSRLLSSKKNSIIQSTAKTQDGEQVEDLDNIPQAHNEQHNFVDSDDAEDELENENENAVDSFLQKLKTSKGSAESDDDEQDSDMDEEASEADWSNNMDEEEEDDENMAPVVDLFSEHFSRSPLPEDDEQKAQKLKSAQTTTTLKELGLSSSIDIQASTEWLKDRGLDKTCDFAAWKGLARSAFECNREFLKQQWKSTRSKVFDSQLQTALYPGLTSYMDMLITAEKRSNRQSIQEALCLHILNHVWTSRMRVRKHNKRIQESEDSEKDRDEVLTESFRDQGFTRPTVLVLLPTRGTCRQFVLAMLALLGGESASVANYDRFEEEYGPPPQPESEETFEESRQRRRQVLQQKGAEWNDLFGDDVNDDDDFKLGLSVNISAPRKAGSSESAAVKLFTDFFKSDIILASPLGLKMACTNEDGDMDEADFLSSIEICALLRSEVMLMQNWDHVNDVLKLVNMKPKNSNNTDFSRVRNYMLAGQGENWRQLITVSQFSDPMIVSSFKRYAKSIAGMMKLRRQTMNADDASIARVVSNVRQVFQRIPCRSFMHQSEDRLKYFADELLPSIRKRKYTLLFIPSYFDFVAVRNLLLKREVDFASITEYSRNSEVNRGRARFLQGRKPLLLYTGRAHYFHRHFVKGVRHLVFYSIPENAHFYTDHVNNMEYSGSDEQDEDDLGDSKTCLSLFSKYDALSLERIVGHGNCKRMATGEKASFVFDS